MITNGEIMVEKTISVMEKDSAEFCELVEGYSVIDSALIEGAVVNMYRNELGNSFTLVDSGANSVVKIH